MQKAFETVETGRGFPLVCLHGLMGEPDNWAVIFPYLPETCRAIALRIPFFEDKIRLTSIPAIQDYARQYLDHVGIDRVVLCGNSLGGHVGLRLALEMPQRVVGLVLTGSSGLFERELGGHRGANPSPEWLREKIAEIFYDSEMATDEMVNNVVQVLSKRRCRRDLVSIAKSAKRDNLAGRLGDVRCPSLLVWGRQDEVTPPEVAEEFHTLLPRSTLAWLDNCGHAPMMERPDEFAAMIEPWLRQYACNEGSLGAPSTAGRDS